MAVRHGYGKIAGADALVFAYDTGDTRNSYRGEPTENLLGATGDMAPPNPDTPYDLTTGASNSNVNGTTWDLSLYPATNLATDNGVAWDPYIKGPGFTGAWSLKKRPGGNWETQFQNGLGAVTNTTSIVLSVWCKATVAGVARINANTTRNGSGNWGNSSAYHSGNGEWEKLYYVIPANDGVTSINVIRCQVGGTTVNTDVYWRHFQVEYGSHSTQFTAGTRSATQGLLDLTGNTSIDLTNVSFDTNAQMTFDATDDYININSVAPLIAGGDFSLEAVIKGPTQDHKGIIPINTSTGGNRALFLIRHASMGIHDGGTWYIGNIDVDDNNWHHVMLSYTRSTKKAVIYVDGEVSLHATTNNMITVATDDRISIGQEWDGGSTSDHFNGEIPVTKIYNRALTAAEVKNNFNNYKGRFNL